MFYEYYVYMLSVLHNFSKIYTRMSCHKLANLSIKTKRNTCTVRCSEFKISRHFEKNSKDITFLLLEQREV